MSRRDETAKRRTCSEHGLTLEPMGCPECGGSGFCGHDCGEDTCACREPDDNLDCDCCGGDGMVVMCPACYEREVG